MKKALSSVKITNELKGFFAVIIVVLIWSGWVVVSKKGVESHLTEWDITFIRFLVASLVVSPFLVFGKNTKILKRIFSKKVIVCSLCCGNFYLITSLLGLKLSQASNIGIIVNGFLPIMSATIIYFWRGTKISKIKLLSIALILLSCLILLSFKSISYIAFLFFLASSAFLAFYSVSMKIWEIDIKTIMFSVPIVNLLFFFPFWLFLPSNIQAASSQEIILQAFYQGIVVSLLALFFMSYSINILGSVRAASIMSLVPIVIVVFSYLFLGEIVSDKTIISVTLCTIGIISYNINGIKKKG